MLSVGRMVYRPDVKISIILTETVMIGCYVNETFYLSETDINIPFNSKRIDYWVNRLGYKDV